MARWTNLHFYRGRGLKNVVSGTGTASDLLRKVLKRVPDSLNAKEHFTWHDLSMSEIEAVFEKTFRVGGKTEGTKDYYRQHSEVRRAERKSDDGSSVYMTFIPE